MAKDLNFKPITDGLGFHPFSDGLPYAPLSKTQQGSTPAAAPTTTHAPRVSSRVSSTGLGAVSAARPQFVIPRKASAQPQQQPAYTTKTQKAAYVPPSTVSVQPNAQKTTSLLTNSESTDLEYGFTYMLKRIVAYGIDCVFSAAVCFGVLTAALWKTSGGIDPSWSPGLWMLILMVGVTFHWLFVTAQELIFKTSLGKRWMGLKLFGGASAIFVRAFFFVPSVLFCGLGVVWALFDRKKRCWHDLVADLAPIEIARL